MEINATKKQMVDYVYSHIKIKGITLTKKKLNLLNEEQLMEIINNRPEIRSDFDEWLAAQAAEPEKKPRAKPAQEVEIIEFAERDPAKAEALKTVVDNLCKDMMEFNELVSNLRYGELDFDDLNTAVERLESVDVGLAMKLLDFNIRQAKARKHARARAAKRDDA